MQTIIDLCEKEIIRATQIRNIEPKEPSAATTASRQLDTYYKHYWENEGREVYITLCKLYGYSLAKVLEAAKEEANKGESSKQGKDNLVEHTKQLQPDRQKKPALTQT